MPNMMYHLSDALRLAVTHKYSAIYADLDFIVSFSDPMRLRLIFFSVSKLKMMEWVFEI